MGGAGNSPEGDYAQLILLGAEVQALFERLAAGVAGLTLAQLHVLATLRTAHPRPLEPRHIGGALKTGSNHVAKLLDQLEAEGLLSRAPHSSDRRRRLVTLTEAGLARVDAALPRVRAAEERLMSEAFEPRERAALRALVTRLRGTLTESVTPVRRSRPGP